LPEILLRFEVVPWVLLQTKAFGILDAERIGQKTWVLRFWCLNSV
jgi:hypothetical protein